MNFVGFVCSAIFGGIVLGGLLNVLKGILLWLMPEKEVEYDLLTDEYRYYRWKQTMEERKKAN